MMKPKIIALFFLSFLHIFNIYSQDGDTLFKSKEDYIQAEPQIKQLVNWYLTTPLSVEQEKREAVQAYLLMWTMGSPSVHVEITT